jgi:hypothetical protein
LPLSPRPPEFWENGESGAKGNAKTTLQTLARQQLTAKQQIFSRANFHHQHTIHAEGHGDAIRPAMLMHQCAASVSNEGVYVDRFDVQFATERISPFARW